MEKNTKEEGVSLKRGVKIALKTFVACFIGIMFVYCSIFVLFPKFSLKINNSLNLRKAKELNYQMIYKRSSKITDLYNVIICEAEMGNYEKEFEYIDEMISRDDYAEFCDKVDKAGLEQASDKSLIPYSVNVNGYLMSRRVICWYNLEKEGIDKYIYGQTKTGKLSEYSFSAYVDLIYKEENLTSSQKREKLSLLINMFDTSGIKLEELLEERVDDIDSALKIETKTEKKVALQYTLTRIYRSRYYVYEILEKEDKKLENIDAFDYENKKLLKMIESL